MAIKSILPDAYFEVYVNNMTGGLKAELKKKTFTASGETSYLNAIKYSAAIMWNYYKKQNDDATTTSVFNTVDVIALSLHPKSVVKKMGLTNACKVAVAEIEKLQELFLFENDIFIHLDDWVSKATIWHWVSDTWYLVLDI